MHDHCRGNRWKKSGCLKKKIINHGKEWSKQSWEKKSEITEKLSRVAWKKNKTLCVELEDSVRTTCGESLALADWRGLFCLLGRSRIVMLILRWLSVRY